VITQSAQFMGCSARKLYEAYMSSAEHAAMTVDGTYATTFRRPGEGDVETGGVGDQLRAIGPAGPDGTPQYSVGATVLELIPDRLIVMSWKNKAWGLALDPSEVTELPSTLVLTFRDNFAGAEIRLDQANVPNYKVQIEETGEIGALSEIVELHWSLLYWDPMRRYFATNVAQGA
jgi:uncharacterized protein YndB with AHSA1/START domain